MKVVLNFNFVCVLLEFSLAIRAVGKTGRGVGAGAGDQWVKPGDWEIT